MNAHLVTSARRYIQKLKGNSTEASLTRKVGGTFFVNVLGTGIAFGLQIMLARILGSADFGKYIYAFTWANLLVFFGKSGLDTAALRFIPEYSSNDKWALLRGFVKRSKQMVLIGSAGLGIGLAAVTWIIQDHLEHGLTTVFYIAAITVPFSAYLLLQCAFLQALRHVVVSQAAQNVLRPLLLGFVLLIFAFGLGTSVSAQHAMWANLLSAILTITAVAVFIRRMLPKEYHSGPREYQNATWSKTAFPLLLITSFDLLLNQADILMVGSILATKEAGIYSAASRITTLIPFSIILVNIITAPVISQLFSQGKLVQLQRMMTRVAWGSFLISTPLCAVIIIAAPTLLGFFGPAFVTGTTALIVLSIGRLFIALTGSVGYLMSMSGHQVQAAYILGIAAFLNIVLNAVLIPNFGIVGAAISFGVTAAFWCTVMVVYAYRLTGINSTVFGIIKKYKSNDDTAART